MKILKARLLERKHRGARGGAGDAPRRARRGRLGQPDPVATCCTPTRWSRTTAPSTRRATPTGVLDGDLDPFMLAELERVATDGERVRVPELRDRPATATCADACCAVYDEAIDDLDDRATAGRSPAAQRGRRSTSSSRHLLATDPALLDRGRRPTDVSSPSGSLLSRQADRLPGVPLRACRPGRAAAWGAPSWRVPAAAPAPSSRLATCAEADQPVSTGLYAVARRWCREMPIYLLRGASSTSARCRRCPDELAQPSDRRASRRRRPRSRAARLRAARRTMPSGPRPSGAAGCTRRTPARSSGYGYVQASGRIGPVAVAEPESLPEPARPPRRAACAVLDGWQAVVPGHREPRSRSLLRGRPAHRRRRRRSTARTGRVRAFDRYLPMSFALAVSAADARRSRRPRCAVRAPDPSTELGAALEVAHGAPVTRPTPSRWPRSASAIEVERQARRHLRDGGRHGRRAAVRDAHRGALPRARAGRRGVRRAGVGAAGGAGSSTPSTAPTTTCAACRIFATLLAFEVDGRARRWASSRAPALHRRWFAWRDGGAWAADTSRAGAGPHIGRPTRTSPASRTSRTPSSSLVVDLAPRLGPAPRLRRAGRARLAGTRPTGTSGATSSWPRALPRLMLESDLKVWDIAAPRLVVEEAGGRLTDLWRRSRTCPRTACWPSTGILHERRACASCAEALRPDA